MAMKQTQTKMFDFADVGLDFCPGSKNLFPDRFKKMLSQGYNEQTVTSVSVTGNQVTLNYGVSHGYAADRVLKINSGALSAINGGEFWIDAITTTSVTLTIDTAPASISGGFVTKIAPIGYSLVYEQSNIHVYKFKHIDDTDMYLRLCFQDQAARRNCISPCIGKTFDSASGAITDSNALIDNVSLASPNDKFKWEFQNSATNSFNSATYTAGVSTFGKGCAVGSIYHLMVLTNRGNATHFGSINGFSPISVFNYGNLDYPMLLGSIDPATITSSGTNSGQDYATSLSNGGAAYVGNIRVNFQTSTTVSYSTSKELFLKTNSVVSYLPANIDSFNTTTAHPLPIYDYSTSQFLGFSAGGVYECHYANATKPSQTVANSPSVISEIDFNHKALIHSICNGNPATSVFLAFPLEEIKNGTQNL